ncbi:hypothetical protein AM593_09390, partial [Mytilus galloprovincialis]
MKVTTPVYLMKLTQRLMNIQIFLRAQ